MTLKKLMGIIDVHAGDIPYNSKLCVADAIKAAYDEEKKEEVHLIDLHKDIFISDEIGNIILKFKPIWKGQLIFRPTEKI